MTRTMVLGLLKANGPMSGYEIQQMMESSQTDLWAYVKPASIYHALKRLQEEGKVVLEKVEKTGMRTKSIFKITEDGVSELSRLLKTSFSNSSVMFPASLYTALTFMENLGEDQIVEALEEQKTQILKVYASMKSGYEKKRNVPGEITPKIDVIFHNIYDQCELQLKWIDEILEILGRGV